MKGGEPFTTLVLNNIHKAEGRFDAFSKRERGLACFSILLAVYVVWHVLVFGPLLSKREILEQIIQETHNKMISTKAEIQAISLALLNDPIHQMVAQIKILTQENAVLQEKMVRQSRQMVSPKEMAKIIKSLVEKTQGLNVTLLESRESKPLFEAAQADPVHFQVYQHGLKLEMTGDYFQILEFLRSMENQAFKVLWAELDYNVEDYPRAKVQVLIDTLGLEEGWIGV